MSQLCYHSITTDLLSIFPGPPAALPNIPIVVFELRLHKLASMGRKGKSPLLVPSRILERKVDEMPPKCLLLLFFIAVAFVVHGEEGKLDSLEQELEKELEDTSRVNVLYELSLELVYSEPQKAREYADEALSIAKRSGSKKHMGKVHHVIGLFHFTQSEDSLCLEHWKKALELRKESGAERGVVSTLGNIGVVHETRDQYPEALEHYHKALQRAKELGDDKLIANNHGNIGVVFAQQGDYPKALEHYFNALRIGEKMGDKQLMASNQGNVGSIYKDQGELQKALDHYDKALQLAKELSNKRLMAQNLGNMGRVYKDKGELSKALQYDHRSLKLKKEIGDKRGMANSFGNIGSIYLLAHEKGTDSIPLLEMDKGKLPRSAFLDSAIAYQEKAFTLRQRLDKQRGLTFSLNALGKIRLRQGKASEALSNFRRSHSIADKIGSMSRKMAASEQLYRTFKELGRSGNALRWHERYTSYKDSVFNEEKQKALGHQEARYEFDKKLLEQQKEQEKQQALAKERNRRQRVISYSAAAGLLMVLAFALLVVNRLRVTRQQKRLIEDQKQLVEEKNQEITDSINYAKRLQEAVLPPADWLDTHLKEHFIMFKPKEIVSGDFYFMDVVEENGKKFVYYSAADCTGHGVPGAMVSIVGANGLKRCIQEFDLRDPGEILKKLSEIVAENFFQSETRIRDGMDLTLCCLEFENGKATRVHYAGANNPLWIINPNRQEWPEGVMPFKQEGGFEVPPTRKAIGYTEDPVPFDSHTIELKEGDSLYCFSDGYPDQFGGEKGKKFKSANFKKLLLSLQEEGMKEQKEQLEGRMEEWKGDLEQVDDICVIGVRV